jgi:hypothetical protein
LLGIRWKGIAVCNVAASTKDPDLLAVLDEVRAIETNQCNSPSAASRSSSNPIKEAFKPALHEDVSMVATVDHTAVQPFRPQAMFW